jgi:4-hydroxybenzoate polyprenyltransferase/phosphoserine phosphatase
MAASSPIPEADVADRKPLILDADGTFLKTDMLVESFWAGLGTAPIKTLGAVFRNFRAPARLKAALYDIAPIRADLLPVNSDIAAIAQGARDEGREVILASASDARLVEALAEVHGMDGWMGSTADHNLKGASKAAALTEYYGAGGYIYAGDARADMPVWESASHSVVVGRAGGAAKRLEAEGKGVTRIASGWKLADLLRAIRPHQWVKNILLFLPAIAAHQFNMETLWLVLAGIAAFSAAASSIYVVNDLLDLEADRLHPKKCRRPFASGAVPIGAGMVTAVFLGLAALVGGALLGAGFLTVLVVYMALSLAYSLRLKRMRWIDIFTLATLYTLRVVAGAEASSVETSVFMLIFIFPIFVTLGCVKRLTELTLATSDERLPGRGYGRPDRPDLLNVASLGMVGALIIFLLYSLSAQALALYPSRWLLWVALVPIFLWLFRMVRLGWQGKQDYDPIVFALRDKQGLGLLMITLALMFYAAGLVQQWFGF